MKISEAHALNEKQQLKKAHLMRNPSDSNQWFITIKTKTGDRFLLADENDEVIVDSKLENLFHILKSLGFNMAKISF